MKERFGSAMCAALVVGTALTLCAQESATAKPITVTGSVGRAQEQPPAAATGTTTATPETKFVLTNASAKTSETTGTSGTAAASTTAISSEYRLDSDDAKLTAHVGHKVEITGTIERPSSTEQKPPASAANAPTLKIESVRMISSTCS